MKRKTKKGKRDEKSNTRNKRRTRNYPKLDGVAEKEKEKKEETGKIIQILKY